MLTSSSHASVVTTWAYVVDQGIILFGKLTILPTSFGAVGTTVWRVVSTELAKSVGTWYQYVWLSNNVSAPTVSVLYLSVSTHCCRLSVRKRIQD
ncbi:hypothetical protein F5051DRAFT_391457 [Lentinula edodes]|nr:hypothetical protein F5051DRAFT_391457 [Lentinula edodes]